MRRRQNNPILTGEAGVGKTAVVEGFALRIARGDVPPPLKDVSLRTLDVGLLQAGASMKGEFENRLRQVIEEVQASPKPIILFIDEAHTLVGAGGAAGTGDAANLLKPALARGNLRTIGATTWAEYKKYIEKDPALTRRFQVVQIDEPSEEKAILMMRGSRVDDGKASSRAGAGRGAGSRGEAVASLHSGAPTARQVGQPARHGLRARGHQPARGAGGSRRYAQAHRSPAKPSSASSSARNSSAWTSRRARTTPAAKLEREQAIAREASMPRGRRKKAWSTASSSMRAKLRGDVAKVEGTGSKLEAQAEAVAPAAAVGGRARHAAWPSSRNCRDNSRLPRASGR